MSNNSAAVLDCLRQIISDESIVSNDLSIETIRRKRHSITRLENGEEVLLYGRLESPLLRIGFPNKVLHEFKWNATEDHKSNAERLDTVARVAAESIARDIQVASEDSSFDGNTDKAKQRAFATHILVIYLHRDIVFPEDFLKTLNGVTNLFIYRCPAHTIEIDKCVSDVEIVDSATEVIIGNATAIHFERSDIRSFGLHPYVSEASFLECDEFAHIDGRNKFKYLEIMRCAKMAGNLYNYIFAAYQTNSDVQITGHALLKSTVEHPEINDDEYDEEQLEYFMRGKYANEFNSYIYKSPEDRYAFSKSYFVDNWTGLQDNIFIYRHNRTACDAIDTKLTTADASNKMSS